MKINEIVKETFEELYNIEEGYYTLVELSQHTNKANQHHFIIATNNDTLVDFWVSEFGVFEASSCHELLASRYEVKTWFDFLNKIKRKV